MGCNIHSGLCETDLPLGRDSEIMSYVHFWKRKKQWANK